MTTMFSFIFVLGVLVFIHELGHFLVAKKVGIRVDKFSLGFPPNIFSRKWGETEYCIGIIPLGGFVKMAGENPDEESTGASDEFMSKSIAQRAAVIFAGPFMNYVLAVVIAACIAFFVGMPIIDEENAIVGEIDSNMPAANIGLLEGDRVIAIDDARVTDFDSMRKLIQPRVDDSIRISWVRGIDTLSAVLKTGMGAIPNAEGGVDTVGMIGVGPLVEGYTRPGVWESVKLGFNTAHMWVAITAQTVKRLVTREVSLKAVGGPLFIAQESGRRAAQGPLALFSLMLILSVNLAVLNLLPVPILDGGHLVFLAVEKIKGSPLSMRARMIAQQIGLVVLLGLILVVTYNDIMRVVNG